MSARILVVDDSPHVLFAATRSLRREGHTVVVARSLAEAEAAWLPPPDLVLLDVNLPDGNGIEASHRWKQTPDRAAVPVILRSAVSVSAAEQTLGLRSGADGYLVEPVEPEVLLATVAAHLRIRELLTDLGRSSRNADELVRYSLDLARAATPDDVTELVLARALALGATEAHIRWRGAQRPLTQRRRSPESATDTVAARLLDARSVPAGFYTLDDLPEGLPERTDDAAHRSWAVFDIESVALTGVLVLAFPDADLRDGERQRFLTTFVTMTVLSLGRAAALELYRSISSTLQHALISEPTLMPGVEVHRQVIVGDGATIAGGDWFDGYPMSSGRQAIICGDVVGHGPEAAGASSILRHTLRTLLLTSSDVAGAIAATNRLVCSHPSRPKGSVLVAEIDPAAREVHLYSAGHPPPVLIGPGGGTAVVPVRPVPALGMTTGSPAPEPTVVRLDSAAILLLITDGVVEHHGSDIDEGYARLLTAVTGAAGTSRAVTAVDKMLAATPPTDDALFVAISITD